MINGKKRMSGKALAIILSAVALTVAVGTTLAYLMTQTPSVTNTFKPVAVDCRVNENFDTSSNTKTNVTVENIGDISAYIRATVVINWVSASGSVYGGAPIEGTDYTLTLGQSGWFKGSDGFYYCSSPVAAGASTDVLISSVSPVADKAPDGYTLSVQIIASAIQAEPAEAVSSVWTNVTVNPDGTLAP